MATPALPPALPSVTSIRRQERRDNYLAGHARSAYRLNHTLEVSLLESSTSSSSTSSSSSNSTTTSCKKGCAQALEELKDAFVSAGQHPLKHKQRRIASYPTRKKQHRGAYRNIRGTPQGLATIIITVIITMHTPRSKPVAEAESH